MSASGPIADVENSLCLAKWQFTHGIMGLGIPGERRFLTNAPVPPEYSIALILLTIFGNR
jgi:hypothetical protein